jgi:outer membrane protein TolC
VRLIVGTLVALSATLDAAAQTATPAATPAPQKTLSLSELVRDALAQNLTLDSARASTQSTQSSVQSASSAFDPRLDFSPSYKRTQQELLVDSSSTLNGTAPNRVYSGGLGGTLPISTSYSLRVDTNRTAQDNPAFLQQGTFSPTVNNTLSFSLSQPLLKGFGPTYAKSGVNIAEFTSASAQARLDRTAEQTIADVEIAYWSLGLAEAVERLSRDSYDRARELMTRNDKMLGLKLISELDAITSRRGEQQRLTSLTDAVRRRQDAAERLLFLVYGRKALERLGERDMVRTEAPPADVAAVPPVQELETKALEARRDYRAARLDVSQSELVRKINKNAMLPDVRMDASYTASTLGTDGVRFFDGSRNGDLAQREWKVGVSMAYPLGNRSARAAYVKARYDAEAAAANLAAFENIVRSQVRASARAIETNRQRLAQAQRSFDFAKQQYEAGQKQLQLGLLDSFRLLQMEEDVSGAEITLEQTRYDLALALTDFALATSTIGQRYQTAGAAPQR